MFSQYKTDSSTTAPAIKRFDAKDIITATKGKFINGYQVKCDIRKRMADYLQNPKEWQGDLYYNDSEAQFSLSEKTGYKKIPNVHILTIDKRITSIGYPHYEDKTFPQLDANIIPHSPWIAAEGPRNSEKLSVLLDAAVYHPTSPVSTIVALGATLGGDSIIHKDFFNYFLLDIDKPIKIDGFGISATKKIPDSSYQLAQSGQYFADTIIESSLSIQRQKNPEDKRALEVILLPIEDNHSINLGNDEDNAIKDAILKILTISQLQKVLIHCAAGIGRTGHLILILEILRHAKEIFEAKTPEEAAAKILEIVKRIRRDRFCLIQIDAQFINAILVAEAVYRYGLTKGYQFPDATSTVPEAEKVTPEQEEKKPQKPIPAQIGTLASTHGVFSKLEKKENTESYYLLTPDNARAIYQCFTKDKKENEELLSTLSNHPRPDKITAALEGVLEVEKDTIDIRFNEYDGYVIKLSEPKYEKLKNVANIILKPIKHFTSETLTIQKKISDFIDQQELQHEPKSTFFGMIKKKKLAIPSAVQDDISQAKKILQKIDNLEPAKPLIDEVIKNTPSSSRLVLLLKTLVPQTNKQTVPLP